MTTRATCLARLARLIDLTGLDLILVRHTASRWRLAHIDDEGRRIYWTAPLSLTALSRELEMLAHHTEATT
jgi:hypothetical protein